MKIAFFKDDESWFWVLDESGRFWECWYERGDAVAQRTRHLDRVTPQAVTEIIANMAHAVMSENELPAGC